ncbi:MAG: hypothetical protein FJ304_16425 [Planctomycetes bacterium]|nr:hypothetical protein [Planctomycetota bacterium]
MQPDYRTLQNELERQEARGAQALVVVGVPLAWLILAALVAEEGIEFLEGRALLFFVLFPPIVLWLVANRVVQHLQSMRNPPHPPDSPE